MDVMEKLSKVYDSAQQISFDDNSNIVLMSDCHRSDGSWSDGFSQNQNSYFAALKHYYSNNYTYIELGDGDELWENKEFPDIIRMYPEVFMMLSELYYKGRLYFIYGNHDMIKKNEKFVKNNFQSYYDDNLMKNVPLFPNIKFHEGLILKHALSGHRIFLLHGHQADYINDQLWMLARFLVRYLWRPLEQFGVHNPTSAAKNHKKKAAIENNLIKWAVEQKVLLIAGHTHRPSLPEPGESPYFNDGSCVHPRGITAIEISNGNIILVKWSIKTKNDGTLYAGRDILAGPRKLKDYFDSTGAAKRNDSLVAMLYAKKRFELNQLD